MVEQGIKFDKDSPGIVKNEVEIRADFDVENLNYKFIVGIGGIWKTIQDFSNSKTCRWKPKEEGKYMIMIQAKEAESTKPYDYLAKEKYVVESEDKAKIIKNISIDNSNYMLGEKVNISVISNEDVLYRFWIKGESDWEIIKDYTGDSTLRYTPTKEGKHEILIQCKRIDSKENFDDYTTVIFDVLPHEKIEIIDFKSLSNNLLINEEISFKVEVNIEDKRNLLYKFVKINDEGKSVCIQDYSSKKMVTYVEGQAGKYRMLCLVKDILSNKEYDDRALLIYKIKPYNKVKIRNFISNVKTPQVTGTPVILNADVEGGKELLYKYVIEGPIAEDSGYILRDKYEWIPNKEGEYNVSLYVKDVSFDGDFEDKIDIPFVIKKRGEKPAKIVDVTIDTKNTVLVGQPINMKINAEGEATIEYAFIVYKSNIEIERMDFCETNWINFTPEEKGEYQIEILVKNKYSLKEYDSHTYVYIQAKDYLPAEIEYILVPHEDTHLVGDTIEVEAITQNTKSILLRYVTSINGHIVEDTGFIKNKKIKLVPRCRGKYTFEIYAKNIKCEEEFDTKKEISIYVLDSPPITDTKVICENDDIDINREATFRVETHGGKDINYEFYLMEKGNWIKVQEYSKKNYYTFIPFVKGEYRVLALVKSFYKKVNYEDYGEYSFKV